MADDRFDTLEKVDLALEEIQKEYDPSRFPEMRLPYASLEKPELLTPGQVVEYDIEMTWAGHRFAAGRRIRLELTSGAGNLVFPNHNTGNHYATDTEYVVAHQTVYHDKTYPSRIILPVVKL